MEPGAGGQPRRAAQLHQGQARPFGFLERRPLLQPLQLGVGIGDGDLQQREHPGVRGRRKPQANGVLPNFATPLFVNNEEIYNVIYTHTHGPWTIEPYLQYTYVPALPAIGSASASTWGGALFVSYAFDAKSKLAGFSLPVRVEYIDSTGSGPTVATARAMAKASRSWPPISFTGPAATRGRSPSRPPISTRSISCGRSLLRVSLGHHTGIRLRPEWRGHIADPRARRDGVLFSALPDQLDRGGLRSRSLRGDCVLERARDGAEGARSCGSVRSGEMSVRTRFRRC